MKKNIEESTFVFKETGQEYSVPCGNPPPPTRANKQILSVQDAKTHKEIIRSSLQRTVISKLGGAGAWGWNAIYSLTPQLLSNYLLHIMDFRRSDEGRVAELVGE